VGGNAQNVTTKNQEQTAMASNKKFWVGLEELHETPEFREASKNEFAPGAASVEDFLAQSNLGEGNTNRRDFLKFLGFGVTAATIAACETPVIKSIPYVNKPESITPGIPTYYASTYFDGYDYASILVKTREGRPIFLKGNKKHGINQGSVNARINASVLSLYDGTRLKGPMAGGKAISWSEADETITKELNNIAAGGGTIAILTGTIISPSTKKALKAFAAKYGEDKVRVVSYDAVSSYGIRVANERSFGKAFIPDYDFSKAKTVVSIAADFMNNWLLSTQYLPDFLKHRMPEGEWMSKHFQFEAALSLTGSNADHRATILPSQEGAVAIAIYNEIARRSGASTLSGNTDGLPGEAIAKAAESLYNNRGESLVVAGCNDPDVQVVVNAINVLLGNYGNTISTNHEVFVKQGNDKETLQLVADMNAGRIQALLIHGVNPAYSLPNAADFRSGLEKVKLTVSFASWADETASLCQYMCPDNHYLESWCDHYPKTGHYALTQPTISRLYDTRQWQESLLSWAGVEMNFHDYMRQVWQGYVASRGSAEALFDDLWYNALRNGSLSIEESTPVFSPEIDRTALTSAASRIEKHAPTGDFEVVLYNKVGIGDGMHATNPWLQELPDPISKITWDNYIAMNPADAERFGFNLHYGQELPASVATLTVGNTSIEAPVIAQPGQKRGTISLALGYGRGSNGENIGKAAYRSKNSGGYELDINGKRIPIGVNAYPLVAVEGGTMVYHCHGAKIEATGKTFPIAATQTHHTLMGRDSVVKETTLAVYKSSPKEAYNPPHVLPVHEGGSIMKKSVEDIDLWNAHPVEGVGHRWGMSIDLNTCIGCGACVTACHSENNVPVVGKDEVRRGRDMHWLRIDRYYSSDQNMDKAREEGMGVIAAYREMEIPEYDNPTTVHMPMMCQHCNHAPCETVCPVAATTHSNEGLNQMTYNRCIGTRYCANNCPYKVRRFNWFNYKAYAKFAEVNPAQDEMARMVLNPDVTVRSRGVMEKCSMCVGRIQAGKLAAKMKGEPLHDGAVVTACAEACPTNAIVFGDLNDPKSLVRAQHENDRAYYALQEVGVKPNVSYKVKVRNA
jgi:molybdopterin-containing oxidoreductase family iron-sulfur binding subunit